MIAIRAVLFDADGVIQNGSLEALPSQIERSLGFAPDDIDALVRDVFEAEGAALSGQADFVELLEPLLHERGAPGKAALLAQLWYCEIAADPAVLALIARLRQRGLLCALATNQQRYRAAYMRKTFGYETLFERSFYSCEMGARKPELRYFETILGSLPFNAEQVLFIDDKEENVAAARQAGLQAAQFVHSGSPEAVSALEALLQSFSLLGPE